MQDASRIDQRAQGRRAHCDGTWRWSRLAGALAVCIWACASAPAAEEGAETIIRLYPSAVVSAAVVTLSDVAEVRGESAELVARMELGGSPHVGQNGSVELSHVQSMLARRGVNLSNWVFRGSSRCAIRRVGRLAAHGEAAAGDAHPRSANPTTRPAEGTEASRAATIDPHTLEGVLREHLTHRLGSLGGSAIIRFSPASARVLTLAKPTFDFRVTNRSDRLLGMVPLEVSILEGGQPRQTVPVLVDVELRKAVIVAARPINRGEIIRADQLLKEERTFDRVEDIGLTETSGLVGQRAKKFIDSHAVLYAKDIEPMPLILTNDLVTVVARRGQMSIRGSAKALSSGGLNETVQLRNEMSRDIFSAVVTGQKTAEVRDAVAQRATAGEPRAPAVVQALTEAKP